MFIKTAGLVLREVEINEADKLLDILTRDHGLVTAKARGVRRSRSPIKSACQLLAYSELNLFEYRDKLTVQEAEPIEQFRELRDELELFALGSYLAQTVSLVAQEDAPNPELLSLILNALYALAKLRKPQTLVKAAYELRLAWPASSRSWRPVRFAGLRAQTASTSPTALLSAPVVTRTTRVCVCPSRPAYWTPCAISVGATGKSCFPSAWRGRI